MKIDSFVRRIVALGRIIPAVLLLGALSVGLVPSTQAQITLTFTYDGTDTTVSHFVPAGGMSALGSVELVGSFYVADWVSLLPLQYSLTVGATVDRYIVESRSFSPPWGSFESTDPAVVGGFTGDSLLIDGNSLYLPTGYDLMAGQSLSGSATIYDFAPTDLGFASNDAAMGSFVGAGDLTVNWSVVNASAIPEPSTYVALAGLAVLVVTILHRLRRSQFSR